VTTIWQTLPPGSKDAIERLRDDSLACGDSTLALNCLIALDGDDNAIRFCLGMVRETALPPIASVDLERDAVREAYRVSLHAAWLYNERVTLHREACPYPWPRFRSAVWKWPSDVPSLTWAGW